jgi:hypothetical protein
MRQAVPYFLSYAHADADDVERYRNVMEPLFRAAARFDFGGWSDHLILPGEHWRAEIDGALERCRFGLLLVSPAFLSSSFITGEELPVLLDKKVLVPVELHRVLFDGSMDLKGLGERQVFRDSKGRSFERCRAQADRREFTLELFGKIGKLMEKYPC